MCKQVSSVARSHSPDTAAASAQPRYGEAGRGAPEASTEQRESEGGAARTESAAETEVPIDRCFVADPRAFPASKRAHVASVLCSSFQTAVMRISLLHWCALLALVSGTIAQGGESGAGRGRLIDALSGLGSTFRPLQDVSPLIGGGPGGQVPGTGPRQCARPCSCKDGSQADRII